MSFSDDKKASGRSFFGLLTTGLVGSVAFGLVAISVPFLLPAARKICLPYVPATEEQIKNVMSLLQKKKKGNVIDLGSGDGRIVIESARLGFPSFGVEMNPWLVLLSRFKATSVGVSSLAKFKRQDLWKTNLKEFDNVVIFGVDEMHLNFESYYHLVVNTIL